MKQSHYQKSNQLYESSDITIYRAFNEKTNQNVILKCLKQYASLQKRNDFKREYKFVSSLMVDGVIQTYGLNTVDNELAIVFEDFNAVSLQSYIERYKPVDMIDAISISIRILEILGRIHDQFILHNAINPLNIIINSETKQIRIIDFGQAKNFAQEMSGIRFTNKSNETILYISPEQTGQLNRFVDYRSDYYSVGATIYELFTSKKLFESDAFPKMIKKIRKEHPQPMNVFRSEIPNVLSEIVLKLLSKLPEERYQSIQGIVYDLNECFQQLKNDGKILPFPTGTHDFSAALRLSQKLYGREKERKQLLNCHERVCQGAVEMVLVKGPAGVGKTSLVRDVYMPITKSKGYFIYGKCDQLQRGVPYSAFVQAFKQLIQFVLSECQEMIKELSSRIQAALKSNAQLLINLIPELESLIGPQEIFQETGPNEMQNRLYISFQNIIKIFCHSDHPLTIFLDDLQWVDTASLNLLEYIVSAPDIQYLLFIGSFRNNEINATHPLLNTLKQLKQKEVNITHVDLLNLNENHLTRLIQDSLNSKNDNIKKLATFIKNKTDGNPIFAIELIKSLYYEKLLFWDSSDAHWQWDIKAIQKHFLADNETVSDNVVNILENRIKLLNPKTIHVLKMASCLGNQFNLLCLSIICEKSHLEILQTLHEAIAEKFVISLNILHDIEAFENSPIDAINMEYRFFHDRVQEAAKNLIPSNERQYIHWHIGCFLRDKLPPDAQEQNLFVIVNNLNAGVASIKADDIQERIKLAQMNLKASRKARDSAAYIECYHYLMHARNHLSMNKDEYWKHHYALMYDIYFEAAEAAYLSGNYDGMDYLVEDLEEHLANDKNKRILQKSKIKEIQIRAYIVQNKLTDAIKVAYSAMDDLEFSLPQNITGLRIIFELLKTKLMLNTYKKNNNEYLVEIDDLKKKEAINIIINIAAGVYISKPELFPILIFKLISLLPEKGYSHPMGFAYSTYGLLLCGIGKIKEGYKYGCLSIKNVRKFSNIDKRYSVKVEFCFNAFIRHWHEHVKNTLEPLFKTYLLGMEIGEIEYASRSLFVHSFFSFFLGTNLKQLFCEIKTFQKQMKFLNQEKVLERNKVYFQAIKFLNSHSNIYDNDSFNTSKHMPIKAENHTSVCNYYLSKTLICYLFREFNHALASSNEAKTYLKSVFATYLIPLINFYDSLTRLALYPSLSQKEKKQYMTIINANQKKMKKWKKHAPMNYAHKYYLVEAERYKVMNKSKKAIDFYDLAIENAKINEFINEQALANELAARYFIETEQNNIAHIYMMDALNCYQEWGATAKVLDIRKQIDDHFNTHLLPADQFFNAFIPVLHTLSSETNLSMLSNKLIEILMEKTAAQKAYIITVKENDLYIEAQSISNDNSKKLPAPLDSFTCLSQKIIRYVQSKRIPVIIEGTYDQNKWVNDPYIQNQKISSILCLPIIYNENLYAVIYLENNTIESAFTKNHLELLQPVFSQAAICFGNVMLYEQLEQHRQLLKNEIDKQINELMDISHKNTMEKILSALRYELLPDFDAILANVKKIQEYLHQNEPDTSISKTIDTIFEKIEITYSEIINIHSFLNNN